VAHSAFTCREISEATGFPAQRVNRLAYPIDAEVFSPGTEANTLQQRLALAKATLLLFVGRLARNKNVPVLVEALRRLRERRPAVHAAIIGDAGDIYAEEARRCRELAQHLGVADRLHFLGQVSQEELVSAYRSADLLVMPSSHEGFCLPVVEAMACGLPVVAARSTALPETVGNAGLTFCPGDAADLARQMTRVLDPHGAPQQRSRRLRVAVVSVRYGTDFAGGAETSLRIMAETLQRSGHAVEVFTTCTRSENDWRNELAPGSTCINGVTTHRFPVDPCDRPRHLAAVQAILQARGRISREQEDDYVRHSVHSTSLVESLRQRAQALDAIVVGPYLFGLTCDIARAFPEKALVVPCFHDEAFARLRTWVEAYERVGGILYHTLEEQNFAQCELGLNHPRGLTIGTWLDCDQAQMVQPLASGGRYVVYCGRYSEQKGLGELLTFARRYQEERPGRFRFVFLGQGEIRIPRETWAHDCGFVDEPRKRALLAGADALVQLSQQESLSWVALEAWVQGTPVIANARCKVLVGQLARSGGGRAIDGYEEFAGALDHLWKDPGAWRTRGQTARGYVEREYGDATQFSKRLEEAIVSLSLPISEAMRRRGLQRARTFSRARWREQMSVFVDGLLHAERRRFHSEIEIRLRQQALRVTAGTKAVLVPVQLVQHGTLAALAEGPGRTVLRAQVVEANTGRAIQSPEESSLPGMLVPGKAQAAALSVRLPVASGAYQVVFWAERVDQRRDPSSPASGLASLHLIVEENTLEEKPCCTPLLDVAQSALLEAHSRQSLPTDYLDVSEGAFAGLKKRIKRKLLGNFKHAYVDVLSRQQTEVNRQIVTAVQHLAECCATLDHALQSLQKRVERLEEKLAADVCEAEQKWKVESGK
jgi:glycosyltransferase involved in cell wall biosynthesis